MSLFLCAILLLGISFLETASNFTQVYRWNELEYKWPSQEIRTKALRDGTFKPEEIYPLFMAVYGSRIFLSLHQYNTTNPVTLVSLATSSASSESPKLTIFPSWKMHKWGYCNKMKADGNPRELPFEEQHLHVLEGLQSYSNWPFTFALDQNGTFWVTLFDDRGKPLRYRLFKAANETKSSETLPATPVIPTTTTISPKTKPSPLTSIMSIPTTTPETPQTSPETTTTSIIADESDAPSTQLPESNQTMPDNSSIPTTTTANSESTPVTALTSTQIQTTTEIVEESDAPSTQLPELNSLTIPTTIKSSTPDEKNASTEVLECSILTEKLHQYLNFIVILVCSNAFTVVLLSMILLKQKRKNCLPANTNESHEMTVSRDETSKCHEFNSRSRSSDLKAAEKSQHATGGEESDSDIRETEGF